MDSCSLNKYIIHAIEQDLMYEGVRFDKLKHYPRKLINELLESGLLKQPYPVEFGGSGQPRRDFHNNIRLIASAYPSLASIFINQAAFGISPLLLFGTSQQVQRFFPNLFTGQAWVTVAFNETSFDTRSQNLTTVAVATDNGWAITGKKTAVLNAPNMDYFLVLADASTSSDNTLQGIFIVPKDSIGVSSVPSPTQIGLASFPIHDLELENVLVTKEALLGGELAGITQFPIIIEQYILLSSALTLGIAQGAYLLAIRHATQERKFGLTLISHQLIQSQFVEIEIKIDALEALIKQVTKKNGEARRRLVAKINLVSADLADYITKVLAKFTGSYGKLTDTTILQFKNDAQMAKLLGGPKQVQLDIIIAPLLDNDSPQ